jgi:Co/Zn/Cd efflux system component
MMDSCCSHQPTSAVPAGYRRVLWIALAVNATMFLVEAAAGLAVGSVSLQADALDFFGDAANYAISLSVLSLALVWRARAALVKGLSMGVFGAWVMAAAVMNIVGGGVPQAIAMGVVGFVALVANVGVALMLYAYRNGDANMRSVWLCSRNDAIGNAAVMLAALGVFGTGTPWPDILVAAVMAALALSAASETVGRALAELKTDVHRVPVAHTAGSTNS